MEEYIHSLTSNNALALAVAALIFIVTVTLVVKKVISFVITLILLFFAIMSGLAIANNDIVRDYLKQWTHEGDANLDQSPNQQPKETTLESIRHEVIKFLEMLINKLSDEKQNPTPSDQQAALHREAVRQLIYQLDTNREKLQGFLDEQQQQQQSSMRRGERYYTPSR